MVSAGSLLDTALATARSLAQDSSPASMSTIKKQVADAAILSARDALLAAEALMYESIDGADVAEGFRSFLEKRPPLFPALGEGTTYDWMSRPVDD